jgi:hypothetical protein
MPPIRSSTNPGSVSRTFSMTPLMIDCRIAGSTPQIVTRRHGPWPSAVENSETPFWAVQASQYRNPSLRARCWATVRPSRLSAPPGL